MEAGIIAALAFLLLVIFIGIFLMRLVATLSVLTKNVDIITRSAVDILGNTNTLLNDVNGKVKTIDPTFKALADLSETVSDLNSSARNVTARFSSAKNVTKAANGGLAVAVGQSVIKSVVKRAKTRKAKK